MAKRVRSSLARVLTGMALATTLAIPLATGPHAGAQTLAALPFPTRPAPPPPPPPAPGQDLWHLDTDTAQFIQGDNGQVHLHVYTTPIGTPDPAGWRTRDALLTKRLPDGSFAPADVPFNLSIAPSSAIGSLVSMTSEDGASLKVGLAPLTSAPLTAVPGQAQGSEVLYPAPDPSSTRDVAVQATASGFNIGIVLHNANESPSIALQVALDDGAYLKQVSSGNIDVTRPITGYTDSGPTPVVTLQPEYVIESPVAISSATGAAAVEHASPASMSLTSSSAGVQDVSVALDSNWLHDSSRIFPVTITIPVITSTAASHTGTFTTVNSCAPTSAPSSADVLVGEDGSCTDQGRVYFQLPPVPSGSTVVSATLGLYAPDQPAATGVQVYMNGPLPFPFVAPSALDPSGGIALPAVAQGAAGVPEEAAGSPWHTWDVTAIVGQWLQERHSNGGFTLMGSGLPVRFSSPMGAGGAGSTTAPVLNITYAPTGYPAPAFSDGASSIFGLSGGFSACNAPNFQCQVSWPISTYGAWSLLTARGYARIEAQFSCNLNTMPAAITSQPQDINTMLNSIFDNQLTPVVVLTPNPNCLASETPAFWQQQANYFVANMSFPKSYQIYFEIGNEPNLTGYNGSSTYQGYGNTLQGYADRFSYAAEGIRSAMAGSTSYRILTGGMTQPSADINCFTEYDDNNYSDAAATLLEAESTPYNISANLLGFAVHPYQYRTNDPNNVYWRNYWNSWPLGVYSYRGICGDLAGLINLWTGFSSSIPVFFTEDNWADQPLEGENIYCYSDTVCEGTYMADLFTWLNDKGYTHTSVSQIRIDWFTGFDFTGKPLGVRTAEAADKMFTLTTCPSIPSLQGYVAVWSVFWWLDYGYTCY